MSELKKLTRLGSDTKKIAALLQAKAPKGHVLAYINPREAALLKQHGGSGTPHEDTGILSFEDGLDMGETIPATPEQVSDLYPSSDPTSNITTFMPGGAVMSGFPTSGAPGQDVQLESFPTPQAPSSFAARDAALGEAALTGPSAAPAEEPSLAKQLASKTGLKEETLGRLGLAGALGVLGSRQASKAGAIGQAGSQQMQALAAPYQKSGQDLQAQAQRGELTPAAQQSLQAVRAQAAQSAERRGGVGAAQTMQQVEAFRQQLLQQQYDYGLKLSSIGDNIALGAIKTGMQADQAVNNLTNSFYTNMAYIASGMTPGLRVGGS